MTTNINGFGVELNSHAQSGKIGVVMRANKMPHPLVEKLVFLCMNLWIMSHLCKRDLDRKAQSNIIYWRVCNPHLMWWLELLN
jgi:hypothetical protein